jgi:phage gp45-like
MVVVDPASGPVGAVFTFRVSQLKPGDSIVFKLEGPKNYAFQGTAHPVGADGTVSAQYHATANNPAGAYTVHATNNGQDAATGTFTIGTTGGTTKTTKSGSPTTRPAVTTTRPAVTTTRHPATTTTKP